MYRIGTLGREKKRSNRRGGGADADDDEPDGRRRAAPAKKRGQTTGRRVVLEAVPAPMRRSSHWGRMLLEAAAGC
jgi:hypothetical protein